MQTMLHKYSKEINQKPVRILEIGSYAGMSTILWAAGIKKFFESGEIICVDMWRPYYGTEIKNEGQLEQDTIKDIALDCGIVEDLFQYNLKVNKSADMVTVIKGDSQKVLPLLRDKSFDVVYIDGNHIYKYVKHDIAEAKRLVKDNGVICGDDLEMAWELVDKKLEGLETQEYIANKEQNIGFHPGVSKAVWEEFGIQRTYEGFWCAQNGKPYDLTGEMLFKPLFVINTEYVLDKYFMSVFNVKYSDMNWSTV